MRDNIKVIDVRESELKEAFKSPQKFVDFYARICAKAGIPMREQDKQEMLEELLEKGEQQ